MTPGSEVEALLAELDDHLHRLAPSHHREDDADAMDEGFRIAARPKRPRRHRRRHSAAERAHRRKMLKLRLRTPAGRRAIRLRRLALAAARRRGLDLKRTSIRVEADPMATLDALLERLRMIAT
jgi:hypothetical protein